MFALSVVFWSHCRLYTGPCTPISWSICPLTNRWLFINRRLHQYLHHVNCSYTNLKIQCSHTRYKCKGWSSSQQFSNVTLYVTSATGYSNYHIRPNQTKSVYIGPNQRYPLSNLDTLPAVTPIYEVDVQPILDNKNNSSVSFSPSAQMHVSMCDMKTIEMFSWRWWWTGKVCKIPWCIYRWTSQLGQSYSRSCL